MLHYKSTVVLKSVDACFLDVSFYNINVSICILIDKFSSAIDMHSESTYVFIYPRLLSIKYAII